MIWIILYFIVGFIAGLGVYDYYCKDYNENAIKLKYKDWKYKESWKEYCKRESPGLAMGLTIFFWPVLIIVIICDFLFQYPLDYIKKRNGI